MKSFKQYITEAKDKVKVLYHDDMDGYGSAYAAWLHFKNSVTYHKVQHGDTLPIKKGDVIYMLDFSVKKPEMLKHLKVASSITVVDHHERIAKELLSIKEPNFKITFDNKKSGASLSWTYFHQSKPPKVIDFIADYDLWAFRLPETKAISMWLDMKIYRAGKDFKALDKLPDIKTMNREGKVLLDKNNEKIDELMKSTYEVKFAGHTVGVVDSDDDTSEIGNRLAKKYPFGVVKSDDPKNKKQHVFGLRSVGSLDVSAIAKKHGGGGHKNASGFAWPKDKKLWNEL